MKNLLHVEIGSKLYVYSDDQSVLIKLCNSIGIDLKKIYYIEKNSRYAFIIKNKSVQTKIKQYLYKYYE